MAYLLGALLAIFTNDDGTWLTLGLLGALGAAGLARTSEGQRGSRYRSEDEMFAVQSTSGRTYNLRLVPPGGSYGLDHQLVNDGPAMLEFYWPSEGWRATDPSRGLGTSPWGTFTGERYHLTTLIKSRDGRPQGLGLQNDQDGQFSADTMNRAIVWALGGNPDSYYG